MIAGRLAAVVAALVLASAAAAQARPPVLITTSGSGRGFEGAFGPGGQLALSFPNLGYVEFYERSVAGSPADSATADLNHGHSVRAVTGFSGNVPVLVSGGTTIRTAVSSWSG